jgi:glycosyltransferase involved in cell wall biosynthesis
MAQNPFFSIVTISYNQADYLSECITSVLCQDFFSFEYIIQDPGSTDGSRDIIYSYSDQIDICLFETDEGPPDGLNKAFSHASGKYFLFINADDRLQFGALRYFYDWITSDAHRHGVYSGGSRIIDSSGSHLRNVYSDPMSLRRAAYGLSILIQPSTAISKEAFEAVGGFNIRNMSNWDGELFIEIALKGFKFARCPRILSDYRLHGEGITGTGRLSVAHVKYYQLMYEKITCSPFSNMSPLAMKLFWIERKLLNPLDTLERLKHGPVYLRPL